MKLWLWLFCLPATLVSSNNETTDILNKIENKIIKADEVDNQPSWVAQIARQLHPQLEEYMQGQVKKVLEAKIGTTLSSVMNKVIGPFEFSSFNVSGLNLKMQKIQVLKLDHESDHKKFKPIKMDFSCSMNGPVEVGMSLGLSTIYLTEVTIKIKARLTAAGPIPRPPFVSGIQMTLLEKPWIDFKFTGATKFLAKQLLHALDEVMETKLGYPNILAMATDQNADPRVIKSMNPTGVLAVNIQRAKNLLNEEGFFKSLFSVASPDTFVKSQLGNAKFETKPILHNQHPVYGTDWIELPLDTLEGYSLDFSVIERSPTADVVYGTAHLHDVKQAIVNNTNINSSISLDISLSDEFKPADNASAGGGDLIVQLKWVPLEAKQEVKQEVTEVEQEVIEVNEGHSDTPQKTIAQNLAQNSTNSTNLKRKVRSVQSATTTTTMTTIITTMATMAKAGKELAVGSVQTMTKAYPGQSERLAMIFIWNLTAGENLAKHDMTLSKKATLEVGKKEGGLTTVGQLPPIPLTFAKGANNQTIATIDLERLVLLGQNDTKAALSFTLKCPDLDSPLTGQLSMEGPSDSLVTVPLTNEGKTMEMKLAANLEIRNLKT